MLSDRNSVAAKSCLVRSKYPTELQPPITDMEEATRRYNLPHFPYPPPYYKVEGHIAATLQRGADETSLPCRKSELSTSHTMNQPPLAPPTTSETTPSETNGRLPATPVSFKGSLAPPDNLEEVKYDVLMEATENFDPTPYKEGGRKVGEGGFGEVFQCLLVLRSGPVHAAVKVLLNKVLSGVLLLLLLLLLLLTLLSRYFAVAVIIVVLW